MPTDLEAPVPVPLDPPPLASRWTADRAHSVGELVVTRSPGGWPIAVREYLPGGRVLDTPDVEAVDWAAWSRHALRLDDARRCVCGCLHRDAVGCCAECGGVP